MVDVDPARIAAQNRKARHDYIIESTLEAGIVLTGSEVKSLRQGHGNITESYAVERDGDIVLLNSYIPEYKQAGKFNHETRRPRKLLLNRKEMDKLGGLAQRAGMTLVPLKIYFNPRGIAKVELGIAKGKNKGDKRESEKKRDWERERGRLLRARG
ncbi:MAG TPA: SsrA-binding protein SmpB [Alphaproteobacteria bacterium]